MRLPQDVGPWRLITRLGRGGMGTVFLGEIVGDLGFRQTVAVKVLDPAQLSGRPELRDALLDEANLMSKLQHPNVVQVHQFLRLSHEVLGETFGMAMEYVEGGTLTSALRATPFGRLPLEAALAVSQDVATALAYAWSFRSSSSLAPLHLIHRDLKPDNILLTRDGHAKVVDFGIAWAAEGRVGNTKTGMTKGTLAYMSPEQIRGQQLDTKSDLYALGVILYELVVGQPYIGLEGSRPRDLAAIVFRASSIHYGERRDLLREILTAPLGAQGHGLSEEDTDRWDSLLASLLEKDPADRLASSEALLDRLEALAQTWRVRAGRVALAAAAVPPLTDAEPTNRNKTLPTDELPRATTSGQAALESTRMQQRSANRVAGGSAAGGRQHFRLLLLLLVLALLAAVVFNSKVTDSEDSEVADRPARIARIVVEDRELSSGDWEGTVRFVDILGKTASAPVFPGAVGDALGLHRDSSGVLDWAAVGSIGNRNTTGPLVLYDLREGGVKEVWRLRGFHEETPEGRINVAQPVGYGFKGAAIRKVEGQETPEVLAAVRAMTWGTSWLLRVSAAGDVLGMRHHPGQIGTMNILDSERVVLTGVNNRLCAPSDPIPCPHPRVIWTAYIPQEGEKNEFMPGCGLTGLNGADLGYAIRNQDLGVRRVTMSEGGSAGFEVGYFGTKQSCAAIASFDSDGRFLSSYQPRPCDPPFAVEPIEGDGLDICARWEKLANDQREE